MNVNCEKTDIVAGQKAQFTNTAVFWIFTKTIPNILWPKLCVEFKSNFFFVFLCVHKEVGEHLAIVDYVDPRLYSSLGHYKCTVGH